MRNKQIHHAKYIVHEANADTSETEVWPIFNSVNAVHDAKADTSETNV